MKVFYFLYTVYVAVMVFFVSLFFVVAGWVFLLLPKFRRQIFFHYLIANPWVFFVNKLVVFARIKIIGKENVDSRRATLYICNHQSWYDIPVFLKNTKAIGISKKQVIKIPLIGLIISYSGTIFVERENVSSRLDIIKKVIRVFKGGFSIGLFPEGTRSIDGKLLVPNNAICKLSYKLNIPVVTSAIEGTRDILPKNRFYFKPFQKVVLIYNKPIYPKDYPDEEAYAKACWDKVRETHEQIMKTYFPGKLAT